MIPLTERVPRCYVKSSQWSLTNEADIGNEKIVLHDILAKIILSIQVFYCNNIACKNIII